MSDFGRIAVTSLGRICLLLLVFPIAAPAATCTWNVASGNWSAAANWSNCAGAPGPSARAAPGNAARGTGSAAANWSNRAAAPGPSTRAPGAGDIAVVVNGTANLD